MRKSAAVLICFVAALAQVSAQGPALSSPNPAINVLEFGTHADAQVSPVGCTLAADLKTLTCNAQGVFSFADVGKSIEVPLAGAAQTSPAPTNATWLDTISSVNTQDTNTTSAGYQKFKTAVLTTGGTHQPSGAVTVTWGTDNSTPFQNAVNACPAPTNNPSVISPFTSKGCVIVVPNPGSAGTGDYMFGSTPSVPGVAVSMPSQVSFQMIGMGNSSKWESSQQAGVRFLTAMSITILSVGTTAASNAGSFQLDNISFVDTSNNGSAIGGLLMNGISEALIAYSSFENFNGQQADFAASTTALSYGMKATAYGCIGTSPCAAMFNNNIVLLHVKGKNNSIFYDASQGKQDGPIFVGGDIFPTNTISPIPANPPWSAFAGCFGIISSGGIRLYGTHFDVGHDNSTPSNLPCVGVLTLSAGIISGKFESSPASGYGVWLGGGSTTPVTFPLTTSCSKLSNAVTCTVTNTFSPGQVVTVSHNNNTMGDQTNLDGNFVVTSASSSQFTYDYPGTAFTSTVGGSASPKVSTSVKVEGIFNNLTKDVLINAGASNNTIFDMSASGAHVTDSGSNDIVQVSDASSTANTLNLGAKTGTVDALAISDAASNTGTGHLVSVVTASGSGAKPVEFASNGNGVEMSTAGVLAPIGTGGITATAMPVSGLTAATASNTILNGNNPLTWNWAQTSNSQAGITFGESSAATNGTLGNQFNLQISGLSGSTAVPLGVFGSLSGSQTLPALYVAPTWNTTGVVDAGILENVTNTMSGNASLLADFQVGGTSEWKVDKTGTVTHLGKEVATRYTTHSASTLVVGDFVLGAGWGNTATLAVNGGTDQAFDIKITPSGTGIAATPTVTLTFHNGSWGQVPVFVCTQTGGTGVVAPITFTNGVATATTLPMIWNDGATLPTSGSTYIISCVGMGT